MYFATWLTHVEKGLLFICRKVLKIVSVCVAILFSATLVLITEKKFKNTVLCSRLFLSAYLLVVVSMEISLGSLCVKAEATWPLFRSVVSEGKLYSVMGKTACTHNTHTHVLYIFSVFWGSWRVKLGIWGWLTYTFNSSLVCVFECVIAWPVFRPSSSGVVFLPSATATLLTCTQTCTRTYCIHPHTVSSQILQYKTPSLLFSSLLCCFFISLCSLVCWHLL